MLQEPLCGQVSANNELIGSSRIDTLAHNYIFLTIFQSPIFIQCMKAQIEADVKPK